MKKVVKYVSERGRTFDTPEEAIEFDKGLASIINIYEKDLQKMLNGAPIFGGKPVTPELIFQWRKIVADYKKTYKKAKKTWDRKKEFDELSKEAQEVAKGMIAHCIQYELCMGMDCGLRKDDKKRKFRLELEEFCEIDAGLISANDY